jgi:HEAT repeats
VRYSLAVFALCLAASVPAAGQNLADLTVGTIDLYGLRTIPARRVEQALGMHAGDKATVRQAELERRLRTVPGVERASVSYVCCTPDGRVMVYAGVMERGTTVTTFHGAPTGTARLPAEIVAAGRAFDDAFVAAIQRGDVAEDETQGHALMHDSTSRAVQLRFVGFATRDAATLRDVLAHASDADQRALAAQVLAYAPDKRTVVDDLVAAVGDPSDAVRNSAVRALALIAKYAVEHPELRIHVPGAPFVDLLNSLVWTDLNKGSWALFSLSEGAHPDTAALAMVRARALRRLIDMARWKDPGHAQVPFLLLARVVGVPNADSEAAWKRGDREAVIRVAERALTTRTPDSAP